MTPDTEHDTAQAVIEAARAVLKHVSTTILHNRTSHKSYLEVGLSFGGGLIEQVFKESDDDLPDTLHGTLAELKAAMEAHDEATIGEDE